MVGLEKLTDAGEIEEVRQMIERHAQYTKSRRAAHILSHWNDFVPKFVKVLPNDYQRMLTAIKRVTDSGVSGDEAVMAAFEANARDVARIGGS
jgi:glutamate synthase (ferredoxin)